MTAFNTASPGAEGGTDGPALELRKEIGVDPMLPSKDWRRVIDTAAAVLFLAPTATGWAQVLLTAAAANAPGGPWFTGHGECLLQTDLSETVARADLWLDAAQLPTSTDRTVRLLIQETACAGSASPVARIQPPQLTYRTDAILVAVTITRVSGKADCSGNLLVPYALQLTEALGSRQLKDATLVPPRTVVAARSS